MRVVYKESDIKLYNQLMAFMQEGGLNNIFEGFEKAEIDPMLLTLVHGPFPLVAHTLYTITEALSEDTENEKSQSNCHYYNGMLLMLMFMTRILEAQELEDTREL